MVGERRDRKRYVRSGARSNICQPTDKCVIRMVILTGQRSFMLVARVQVRIRCKRRVYGIRESHTETGEQPQGIIALVDHDPMTVAYECPADERLQLP